MATRARTGPGEAFWLLWGILLIIFMMSAAFAVLLLREPASRVWIYNPPSGDVYSEKPNRALEAGDPRFGAPVLRPHPPRSSNDLGEDSNGGDVVSDDISSDIR